MTTDNRAAIMWPISQIVERDKVSRQAVSKKVNALIERHQLMVERDGRGRVAKINVAQYDHLRERFGDAHHAQAPRLQSPPLVEPAPSAPGDSLDEAQRQKAWIDADRARMRLDEEKGELMRVAAVAEAVGDCGIEIARIVDRLPMVSDDIAAAVGRDGAHGVRVALKALAQKMREDIAAALSAIAAAAPEFEREANGGAAVE